MGKIFLQQGQLQRSESSRNHIHLAVSCSPFVATIANSLKKVSAMTVVQNVVIYVVVQTVKVSLSNMNYHNLLEI